MTRLAQLNVLFQVQHFSRMRRIKDQGSRAEEGDQPQHRQGLLLHHAQYGAEPEPAQHQGEVIHLSKKEVGFFLLFKLTIKCTVAGAALQLLSKSENCDGWSV